MSLVVDHPAARPAPHTQRRSFGRRVRRAGLGVFFVSIAVNAALGIYAVLAPDFGETQGKILATSLCVTGALLMALACEPAWERRLLGQIPAVGALLGAASFAGVILGIWTEPESETFGKLLGSTFALAIACTVASLFVLEHARKGITLVHERVLTVTLALVAVGAAVVVAVIWAPLSGDTVGKIVSTGMVVAAACLLAAFLTLARLARNHEWVLEVALGLLVLGAALVAVLIWAGDVGPFARMMGVALIAFAAFAVTVPVLHWLDRGAMAVAAATTDAVRFCPHCGKELSGELGVEVTCSRCGRGFTITRASSA